MRITTRDSSASIRWRRRGQRDFGLLYIGFADGGSGGDPLDLAQNLNSAFGKILRIDPLGSNSTNQKYGIPASNPFVNDNNPSTLGEIYASGVRNPQRFAWDPKNGNLFLADIGQNTVEEISIVTAGANLGWNDWEGSFTYVGREGVGLANRRGDAKLVYPIVEYGQPDPLLQPQSAVTIGSVYRQTAIKQLTNLLVFGDNPSGEIFYIDADKLPNGGQESIRRILLNQNGIAQDAARRDQGDERQAGEDAGDARGPALRPGAERSDLPPEQGRRHHQAAGPRREVAATVVAPFPDWVEPMAATLTQERFTGPEWIFERKLDGIRLLAFKNGAEVRLLSRNQLPLNGVVSAVAAAIASLPVQRRDPRRRSHRRLGPAGGVHLPRLRHSVARRARRDVADRSMRVARCSASCRFDRRSAGWTLWTTRSRGSVRAGRGGKASSPSGATRRTSIAARRTGSR